MVFAAVPYNVFSQDSGETAASPRAESELSLDAPAPDRQSESELVLSGEADEGGASSVFLIFRMVLVLALVAALIYLLVFAIRRISRPKTESNPHLKVLASASLGGGNFVHVVGLGAKAWLVGAADGNVSHIADVDDREVIDAMILDSEKRAAEEAVAPFGFRTLLQRFGQGGAKPDSGRIDRIRSRRERFRGF